MNMGVNPAAKCLSHMAIAATAWKLCTKINPKFGRCEVSGSMKSPEQGPLFWNPNSASTMEVMTFLRIRCLPATKSLNVKNTTLNGCWKTICFLYPSKCANISTIGPGLGVGISKHIKIDSGQWKHLRHWDTLGISVSHVSWNPTGPHSIHHAGRCAACSIHFVKLASISWSHTQSSRTDPGWLRGAINNLSQVCLSYISVTSSCYML